MNTRLKILFAFFIFLFFQHTLFSQTPVSGVINKYTKVTNINISQDTLVVTDATQFSDGDTVMVMQMRGATGREYLLPFEELHGTITLSSRKKAGKYEIIIVKEVLTAQNKIVLRNPLAKLYDTSKKVQLISVPYFSSAIVSSTLTCDPWDGDKGGVLVIMVADTLVLNANIDVTGKGFRGAEPVLSSGDCASSDSLLYRSFYFPDAFTGAGRRGEGVADDTVGYSKGLGRWSNAGGGGNARFSGGGGGGGAGNGGGGGREDSITCITPKYTGQISDGDTLEYLGIGGRGGQGLGNPLNLITDSTIFLGGGGGSGTYTSGLTASKGGNGGGIVLILSNYVKPNGFSIIANGQSVTDTVTASGAGGGGAGVIVLDVETVQSDINLLLVGGKGGDTKGSVISGPGGGGGGGILLNGSELDNPKFLEQITGGRAGKITDMGTQFLYDALAGWGGTLRHGYSVPLTGFLFNSILENQRICIGDVPKALSGSLPRGGDGEFKYQWQKRTPGTSWVFLAPDDTLRNFQPPALIDTTFYRRIVSSAGIVDTSIAIGIYIHKKIVGNTIEFNELDTICIDNTAGNIIGEKVTEGGDGSGIYAYTWQSSFDLSNWNTIAPLIDPTNPVNDTICWGGVITDTTYYRRRVASGACYSFSDTVEIIGLPKIANNTLLTNQEICYAQIPEPIVGANPSNGLGVGSYQYSWQKSLNGTDWTTISDSTRKDFAPSNLIETTYYRRKVISGDCEDFSEAHKVNVLPLITVNTITNLSVIPTCYNIPSALLTGLIPSGGNLTYQYQWQISNDASTWIDILDNSTSNNYQPVAQTEKKYYRRIVVSGFNDCCADTSNYITVTIWPLPSGIFTDEELDTTICSNQPVNLNLTINSGEPPYTLYYSDGYSPFVKSEIATVNTAITVNPVSLETSKQFTYTMDSLIDINGCKATSLSGEPKVLAYGNPVPEPGDDTEICDTTIQLHAVPSLGTGIWKQTAGPGLVTFENELLNNSHIFIDVAGLYTLQWKETNWECSDSATVDVLLYRQASAYAGDDTTLHYELEYELHGKVFNPDIIRENETTWLWEKNSGPGEISNAENSVAILSKLDGHFKETVELTFKVIKPLCPVMPDTVKIQLEDILLTTGFSPNGDTHNDYFVIRGSQNSKSNELIIFNKWGTEVYRKKDYGKGDEWWDGKNMKGNMLPEDTYFYILNYIDSENKSHTIKGFVVLKGTSK